MKRDLLTELEDLKQHIETMDISTEARAINEWDGADVIISSRLDADTEKWLGAQPFVVSFQSHQPRRRAVITKYSKELSWLFHELGNIFSGKLDYVTKYDFYGLLAQSAIDYLAINEETQETRGLLITVLNTSKGFFEDEPSN